MNYPSEKIMIDKNLYEADVHDILSVLVKTEDNIDSLMIFTHNPGLTNFANFISERQFDNIPTSAVVSVKLKVKDWNELDENTCDVEFFEYPKKYFR